MQTASVPVAAGSHAKNRKRGGNSIAGRNVHACAGTSDGLVLFSAGACVYAKHTVLFQPLWRFRRQSCLLVGTWPRLSVV